MAKVPITLPSEEMMGLDQTARSEGNSGITVSRKSLNKGLLMTSETMTCLAKYAAGPHEPQEGWTVMTASTAST